MGRILSSEAVGPQALIAAWLLDKESPQSLAPWPLPEGSLLPGSNDGGESEGCMGAMTPWLCPAVPFSDMENHAQFHQSKSLNLDPTS